MSAKAMFWALDQIKRRDLPPSAKLVLIALANRHNQETGRCDPAVTTIAKDSGISERSARDGLRALEEVKLVTTIFRTAKTGRGKRNLNSRYKLGGGAKSAGGVGQNLPGNLKDIHKPRSISHFDDVVMTTDVEDCGDVWDFAENGQHVNEPDRDTPALRLVSGGGHA